MNVFLVLFLVATRIQYDPGFYRGIQGRYLLRKKDQIFKKFLYGNKVIKSF